MTRMSSAFLVRRAYEHVTASVAAIVLTALAVVAVTAHAGDRKLTPSVTIQVPTVEIEVLDDSTAHVASIAADRVNG
jgi:hypothetical protein